MFRLIDTDIYDDHKSCKMTTPWKLIRLFECVVQKSMGKITLNLS